MEALLNMYDIIGDIHGHIDKLTALLRKMDYVQKLGAWSHPDGRKIVFAGDYIDRGPGIKEVLNTVRSCVDAGLAVAIMGNHEFNAIAFETLVDPKAEKSNPLNWCRERSSKNIRQYDQTMRQLGDARKEWIDWFRTLAPSWQANGIRVVHACWNEDAIQRIHAALAAAPTLGWDDELIRDASSESQQLYFDAELVFKGLEVELPGGQSYQDKEGTVRTLARVQWWRQPAHDEKIGNWLMPPQRGINDAVGYFPVDQLSIPEKDAPITCIGHYWMPPIDHEPVHDKIVCVDYSVAKGGHLCAYRFNGEEIATAENLVYV